MSRVRIAIAGLLTGICVASAADVPTIQVRICIPPKLITEEWWQQPAQGSDIAAFKRAVVQFVATHGGSGQFGYWIRDDAFDLFRTMASPDPRWLIQEASAQSECPASNYTAELEVDADVPASTQAAAAPDDLDASPTALAGASSDDDSAATAAAVFLGIGALWCAATDCLGGSSDTDDSASTSPDYYYEPPYDPYNNPYQQYLDEQHAACVWAHSDISHC